MTKPTTLGELKQTEWASPARIRRTVKDELRENLICLLENGSPLFPGIVGYEDSVIPQLVNAVLTVRWIRAGLAHSVCFRSPSVIGFVIGR